MKTLKLFLLIAITTLLFTTCRKYPEGGWSNVAIKHLFGGNKTGSSKTWHLKKYEVNGIDSTIFITPGNGYTSFENNEVIFEVTYKKSETYCKTKVYNCFVYFTEKKRILRFSVGRYIAGIHDLQCYNGACERNILNPYNELKGMEWSIIKLTNRELIMTVEQNSNNYKIALTH